MHKKLEAELISLAHSILQMKNKDEAAALRDKARLVYEKLAVLTFVDEYAVSTPEITQQKEEILKRIDAVVGKTPVEEPKIVAKPMVEPPKEPSKPVEPVEDKTIFEPKFDSVRIDLQSLKKNQISSKEEFRDAISADKTASLFDEPVQSSGKKTLNDRLFSKTITVGLNDRIAFVNNLFASNQTEFNRVLSQLNTFATEKEAKDFINNTIKPDYDWAGKEAYEERLIALIERKFA